MTNSTVTRLEPPSHAKREGWVIGKFVAAFFAIYVVWGTSYFAIRVVVQEVPPLLAAGTRFFAAGVLLVSVMRLKGQPNPRGAQWRNLAIIGLVMFAAVYGPLFWAERYVSSGTASVLEATIPLITIGMEVFLIRNLPFRWSLIGAAVLGFCGVGVLLLSNGDQPARLLPCIAVLAGASAWSLGSVLNRTMDLPASKPLTAGASMMLGGVALFALSLLFGELRSPPNITLRSAAALAYLIVFASLVSFTAFVWLLGRMPASQVASHAYVNPVVAIALGYFAGGETISWRMLAGSGLIVLSVFLILRKR